MSHNTCMAFPPSGLIVYTPLDVTPSWYSRAQLLGTPGWRKIWFESYAWTTVKVIYFYLVMGGMFLLIMNDYYVCKIPTTTTITTTKEIYWEEGLINKYRSCVHLALEVWKHYCAGFLVVFFFCIIIVIIISTYYRAFLSNHPCKCIVHCWFECLRCRFRSCHNLTYLVRIRSDCKQQQ